ncbi:MAG: hypothetical protein WBN68_16250, partial [Sedimenticolaceae bacterium]
VSVGFIGSFRNSNSTNVGTVFLCVKTAASRFLHRTMDFTMGAIHKQPCDMQFARYMRCFLQKQCRIYATGRLIEIRPGGKTISSARF